jgi:phenylacetate-CoA ligase
MSVKTFFFQYLLCPLYRGTKGAGWARDLEDFKEVQRSPAGDILSRQWERVKEMLRFSYENVPYYKRVWGERGITPEDIKTPGDMKSLPYLTKREIIDHGDELLSKNRKSRGLFMNSSGGSTGVNLRFYQDGYYQQKRVAGVYWGNELAGWRLGEPTAYLWGIDDERVGSQRDRWHRFLKNEMILNAFNMTKRDMETFYRKLVAFRVRFIIGYASSLHLFFTFLKEKGLSIPTLVSVISSAEVLHVYQRKFLEKECGIKVFDRYGSREVGLIASECNAHDGMHICTDTVFVEEAKYHEPDSEGEIIVTSLINYAMPFIRYRVEDVGIFSDEPCTCGRHLPRIRSVIGRTTSVFVASDGRYIHGEYFTHLFYGVREIEKFQFIQKERDRFLLKIVPGHGFNESRAEQIVKRIKTTLGNVDIVTEVVRAIEPARSGKYLFTYSEIPVEL